MQGIIDISFLKEIFPLQGMVLLISKIVCCKVWYFNLFGNSSCLQGMMYFSKILLQGIMDISFLKKYFPCKAWYFWFQTLSCQQGITYQIWLQGVMNLSFQKNCPARYDNFDFFRNYLACKVWWFQILGYFRKENFNFFFILINQNKDKYWRCQSIKYIRNDI